VSIEEGELFRGHGRFCHWFRPVVMMELFMPLTAQDAFSFLFAMQLTV